MFGGDIGGWGAISMEECQVFPVEAWIEACADEIGDFSRVRRIGRGNTLGKLSGDGVGQGILQGMGDDDEGMHQI